MSNPKNPIVEVALPIPLHKHFDYAISDNATSDSHSPGCRVEVKFGNRLLTGVIVATKTESDIDRDKLITVHRLLDRQASIPTQILSLAQWLSDYYQYPYGQVLDTIIPNRIKSSDELEALFLEPFWRLTTTGLSTPAADLGRAKKQQELLSLLKKESPQSTENIKSQGVSASTLKQLEKKGLVEKVLLPPEKIEGRLLKNDPITLNEEQKEALESIKPGSYGTYLIQGVTGSGKTEVYLQAIERALEADQQCLVLIPEIGLSPQTLNRFISRFNRRILAFHSGVGDGERAKNWLLAKQGLADIIIGTRSAASVPLPRLGLIVVDEEHDSSYKQQDGLRYSARDLAVIRGSRHNCPVILGSATPSLESYQNAAEGRYSKAVLTHRANQHSTPGIQFIDPGKSLQNNGLTHSALEALESTLKSDEQAIVFINRRGYAPQVRCRQCSSVILCPKCDQPLTLHRNPRRLCCHHCDYSRTPDNRCGQCGSHQLEQLGQGTEKVEETLADIFGDSTIIRIDRDTMGSAKRLQDSLMTLQSGKPCIVVGTQMIAKGHHFENVTRVVVVDADSGLFSADFRATEKLLQLLIQVSGRAGRGKKKGNVLIQTHYPDHPLFKHLTETCYDSAANFLLETRRLALMPPFTHLAVIRAECSEARKAIDLLEHARQYCEALYPPCEHINYLGPTPALIEKRQNRFRFMLQINSSSRPQLQKLLKSLTARLNESNWHKSLRWSVDVDPQDMS